MNLPSLPRTEKTYKSDFWPTVIKYRAFTAGQQTLLLQVSDPQTPIEERAAMMESLFSECVNAGAPFNKLPIGVVEEVFIRMRMIAIGELMKIRYKCNNQVEETIDLGDGQEKRQMVPCEQELTLPIPLNNVKCIAQDGFQETFDLPGGYHLKMRQPSFSDATALSDAVSVEMMLATFIDCLYDDDGQVWKVENPEEIGITPEEATERRRVKEAFVEWVKDNIESDVIDSITKNFFHKIPRIHYKSSIKCPKCGKEHKIEFNSINEIFI